MTRHTTIVCDKCHVTKKQEDVTTVSIVQNKLGDVKLYDLCYDCHEWFRGQFK